MNKSYIITLLALTIAVSCQERIWDNPFDPECPKEIFTPTELTAQLVGSVIQLSWNQPNPNISGYEISKITEGGNLIIVSNPSKESKSWSDANTMPGQRYSYTLTAKAGSNRSNVVSVEINRSHIKAIIETQLTTKTYNSVTFRRNVVNDGGGITEYGIVYSTSSNNPTLNNDTKAVFGSSTNQYELKITGLNANTNYYARAYAINPAGISYGSTELIHLKLNVPGPNITDIDGNVYKTVQIGNQVWMAENLKATKYNDGTPIPYVSNQQQWATTTTGAYCFFANSTSFGQTYGNLYNFFAATNSKKLCPSGWHLPSDQEWTELSNFLGGSQNAGGLIKMQGTEFWANPNAGATNSSGFSAKGASWRGEDGLFYYWVGWSSSWWSSTSYNSTEPWSYSASHNNSILLRQRGAYFKNNAGVSVRCIKD